MTSLEQEKRLRAAVALWRPARRPHTDVSPRVTAPFEMLDTRFHESLARNEPAVALEIIEAMRRLTETRGGFWGDLIRATRCLQMDDRVSRLKTEFDAAIIRRQHAIIRDGSEPS